MNVITTFPQKQREKQIRFERRILRELSIEQLKRGVQQFFGDFHFGSINMLGTAIEEGCYDIAIEAFLLGSKYSRLGYYGLSWEEIKERTSEDRRTYARGLAEFIDYWSMPGKEKNMYDSLLVICEHYVEYWIHEGFLKGKQHYKMRLH